MPKRPLALLLGITGDLGCAAGCLLLALRRHSPGLRPDILIYCDGSPPAEDQDALKGLGARLVPFTPPPAGYRPESIRQFSFASLARFEGLLLLERYKTVIWLDADIALQDDITDLTACGPLAMATEDPSINPGNKPILAATNVVGPVTGLDCTAPNLNSGVLVLQDSLPDPRSLYRECMDWIAANAPNLGFIDQAALNMLAQNLARRNPSLFQALPCERFNCHPRNPGAKTAAIVHTFGPFKIWYDGLMRCAFPEWERDYQRWLALGGSPWRGYTSNMEYHEGGAFYMLTRLFDLMTEAQNALEQQAAELHRERLLRHKLEQALRAVSKGRTDS